MGHKHLTAYYARGSTTLVIEIELTDVELLLLIFLHILVIKKIGALLSENLKYNHSDKHLHLLPNGQYIPYEVGNLSSNLADFS